MGLANLKRILAVAMLSSIAFAVYANEAPVYEVDNYPPSFDGQPVDAPSIPADSGGLAPEISQPAHQSQVRQEAYVPSPATSPPPRPLTMEQRVQRTEQQIKNLQQSNSTSKTEELQKEVQSLRGQVEEMSHQLQQAQTQLKAMFGDLDNRISTLQSSSVKISTASPDVSVSAVKKPVKHSTPITASVSEPSKKVVRSQPNIAVATSQPNIAEEQQIYQTAYDLIKAKKYNDAISTLQKMLQKYPMGQSAAIAHYWLGELYGLVNKSEQSRNEFSTVVKKYPSSSRAPDAQLKLGLIYAGQFQWSEAKVAFKGILSRYPGTPTSKVASEQLKQIKKAGH